MTIPPHIIDLATEAYCSHDGSIREGIAAAINAAGKRIWDSGYEAGKEDAFLRAFGHKPIPNPYRSEDK